VIGVDACKGTLRAALAIRDPRVVVVEMEQNVGTYQTLNALIGHAHGSLIAVMDSDDVSRPGRLSAGIVELLENPKVGIVAGYYRNCDEALRPTAGPTKKLCHGAMMVRRQVYEKLGGYKPWRCGADWDFFTRVEKLYQSRLHPKTFLLRRVHSGSLCQSPATRPKSPAREFAFAEIEKEKLRPAPTVVKRDAIVEPHRVVRDWRPKFKAGVGVVMPTIPGRSKTAAAVVRTMLAQGVDKIHVHLNGHGAVPAWARHPRVRAFLHAKGTGPIVRFSDLPDCEHVLSVDDDIAYPPDYVRRTVAQLQKHGPRTALSYHASWWAADAAPEYQARQSVTYDQGLGEPKRVPYGGSGVAAFHTRDLSFLDAGDAPPGFAMEDDVWISAALARTGVKLVRPPSSAGWIKATGAGAKGLYTKATANGFRRRNAAIAAALGLGVWRIGKASTAPTPSRGLDEKKFWGDRYEETGTSILTVGRRDASVARNNEEYAKALWQFRGMVRKDFPDPAAISVLDVGFGLGHYAKALAQLGVKEYVGIDFASSAAPPELLERGFEFRHGVDASQPGLDLGRTFDLVVVIDVMFHIVEEARFARAVENLKRHASGLLYITGLFQDRQLAPHVRHRSPPRFRMGEPVSLDKWRDNKIARFRL